VLAAVLRHVEVTSLQVQLPVATQSLVVVAVVAEEAGAPSVATAVVVELVVVAAQPRVMALPLLPPRRRLPVAIRRMARLLRRRLRRRSRSPAAVGEELKRIKALCKD
jgi:hypothetical protein